MGPEHAARRQLEDVIFPFWLANGIDEVNGGYYTCFDNRGRTRLSTDKYTWSQGRFVWLLARAARLAERGLLTLDAQELLAHAERGARFLVDHAVRPGGTCAYLLDETGTEKPSERSVYADCFVAMGLSELSRQTGSAEWLDVVDPIVARAAGDITNGDPPTPPYPLPPGHSGFGARMILLNARLDQLRAHTAQLPPSTGHPRSSQEEQEEAASGQAGEAASGHARGAATGQAGGAATGHAGEATSGQAGGAASGHAGEAATGQAGGGAAGLREELAEALQGVLAHREETGLFAEILVDDPGQRDTVLARHRNPGHALEGAWMMLEAGELLGDHRADERVLDSISKLCATGWDVQRGGLLRYTDVTGRRGGGPYEELIVRTWTTKLWWVHTEAAYSTRLAAVKYGDKSAERWFGEVWGYTLDTFPGRDDGEEWVQIRDRDGRPLDEVVALPVKDPYHIARNLMQIVELGEG
ncbi:AGE family epimerase/isomerase [Nonomuraea sp. NPDC050394]|uniref:AGE family epimerase/isomerase n=1 Tax=Nonomuraea sp. NPDC050394 TaxID=3364363 RepID=UPI0037943046